MSQSNPGLGINRRDSARLVEVAPQLVFLALQTERLQHVHLVLVRFLPSSEIFRHTAYLEGEHLVPASKGQKVVGESRAPTYESVLHPPRGDRLVRSRVRLQTGGARLSFLPQLREAHLGGLELHLLRLRLSPQLSGLPTAPAEHARSRVRLVDLGETLLELDAPRGLGLQA